mmetsp:Transcript_67260/g.112614  ORF Transcript_67260/g.112614 Transcript_67260/m.112614 type:complete len:267 (+) Transcript_67260:6826-7626(+)
MLQENPIFVVLLYVANAVNVITGQNSPPPCLNADCCVPALQHPVVILPCQQPLPPHLNSGCCFNFVRIKLGPCAHCITAPYSLYFSGHSGILGSVQRSKFRTDRITSPNPLNVSRPTLTIQTKSCDLSASITAPSRLNFSGGSLFQMNLRNERARKHSSRNGLNATRRIMPPKTLVHLLLGQICSCKFLKFDCGLLLQGFSTHQLPVAKRSPCGLDFRGCTVLQRSVLCQVSGQPLLFLNSFRLLFLFNICTLNFLWDLIVFQRRG